MAAPRGPFAFGARRLGLIAATAFTVIIAAWVAAPPAVRRAVTGSGRGTTAGEQSAWNRGTGAGRPDSGDRDSPRTQTARRIPRRQGPVAATGVPSQAIPTAGAPQPDTTASIVQSARATSATQASAGATSGTPATRSNPDGHPRLVGHVIDSSTGAAVPVFEAQARGGLGPATAFPGEPGLFIVDLVRDTGVAVHIESAGLLPLDEWVPPVGGGDVERWFSMGRGATVTGRVVGDGGIPQSRAIVSVEHRYRNPGAADPRLPGGVYTGSDGRFSIARIPPGVFAVAARSADERSSGRVELGALSQGETRDVGDIILNLSASVEVLLVDAWGQPMPGVAIWIHGQPDEGLDFSQNGRTDGAGLVSFAGVPGGVMTARCTAHNVSETVETRGGGTRKVTLRAGGNQLTVRVSPASKAASAVVQMTRSESNAVLFPKSVSDGNTLYIYTGLKPGVVTLRALGGGSSTRHLWGPKPLEITAEPTQEFVIDLQGRIIRGRVIDGEGKPVPGAEVRVAADAGAESGDMPPDPLSTRSDGDGRFSFDDVMARRFVVSANGGADLGRSEIRVEAPADGGNPVEVEITLKRGGGTVIGTALRLPGGEPMPDAWMTMNGETMRFEHGATRDAKGVMRVENVPAGTYLVDVSAYGFSVATRTVDVADGRTVEFTDVLYEAGAVRVVALSAQGSPLKNATTTFSPMDPDGAEAPRRGTTGDSAMWIIRGLKPGKYDLTAEQGGRKASATVEILARQIIDATVRFE